MFSFSLATHLLLFFSIQWRKKEEEGSDPLATFSFRVALISRRRVFFSSSPLSGLSVALFTLLIPLRDETRTHTHTDFLFSLSRSRRWCIFYNLKCIAKEDRKKNNKFYWSINYWIGWNSIGGCWVDRIFEQRDCLYQSPFFTLETHCRSKRGEKMIWHTTVEENQ